MRRLETRAGAGQQGVRKSRQAGQRQLPLRELAQPQRGVGHALQPGVRALHLLEQRIRLRCGLQPPAHAVEHGIAAGEHHHRNIGKGGMAAQQAARLVTVQAGHQNVAKNEIRMVIVDFRQGIKPVFRQNNLIASLTQKNFR